MLKVVNKDFEQTENIPLDQKRLDHDYLISQYLNSHHIRNHSPRTISKETLFLNSWFKNYNSLFVWKAMEPQYGRDRIIEYANLLLENNVSHKTMRSYLGILSRLFTFILEHPFIKKGPTIFKINQIYGPIEQPVSEYDIPKHTYDGEQLGVPMDPESLFDFYHILQTHYLKADGSTLSIKRARYYTMAVIEGLCGLRSDEIIHLDIKKDIFFKSFKLQTRFAKGTSGSGKRARVTLFPPFARDTLKFYINNCRKKLYTGQSDLLFPNTQGEKLSYSSIHNALREMIVVANKNELSVMKHMSWHWFRRFFATRFIEANPHQLSILIHLLGHTSPNTVHKYIRHSEAWMDTKILKALQGDFL